MEHSQDVERIHVAIQKLIQEKRRRKDGTYDDDEEQLLLSKLLSQLKSAEQSKEPTVSREITGITLSRRESNNESGADGRQEGANADQIAKELRAVKKQHRITHCLLSALIVLTLGWQLSEVSLILKLKDGLSHPFRSLGKILVGALTGPSPNGGDAVDKQNSSKKQQQTQQLLENPFALHPPNA